MGECVARIQEKRKAYRVLVGKPESKRPCGRIRQCRYTLKEIG
jgi:hypothetical protein